MLEEAQGFLGLMPWDFWRMTPKEYYLRVKGYRKKDERETQKQAQLAAWIMQPHLKKQITPDMLLKKQRTEEDAKASKEAFERAPQQLRG
jgi:hypothetical protein